MDVLLVLLVAALAFLLASFPVRDGDFWAHLAAGRSLARGGFSTGFPGNPSWLYDLLCYVLYSSGLGGPGLAALKALLAALLALVMLRLSWAGRGLWAPAVCTALALLAMSTRLLLQPAIVSTFFLALALWLLRPRPGTEDRERAPPSFLPPWPLMVLFVVWVNVDAGFLLGLATVALMRLGQTLEYAFKGGRKGFSLFLSSSPRLLVFVIVLAAACLLNPAHLYAFAPPAEPGWFGTPGPSAARLATGQVTSPFQGGYFLNLGLSPAGLAYFPLLGLGLLSLFLNLPRWAWRRFLPWLGLLLWTALQVRAVPYFAVVAGPVLAWNLQDFFARRYEERSPSAAGRRGGVLGPVLALLWVLALVVCAWPGWLQFPPFEPRRWAVEVPPSLESGAATTRRWLRDGKLGPDARGLHLSPETVPAFAWFCPEEKNLRDDGLAAAVLKEPGKPDVWGARLRTAGVNHLILYDPDHGRLFTAVDKLLAEPEQWPLLYREGDLAVFGWRDPAAAGDRFRGLEWDPDRLAFHPDEDKKAPEKQPDGGSEARPWWDAFWKPAPPRSIDRDEATLHLFHAEGLRRSAARRQEALWEGSQFAGLLGAVGGWAGPAGLFDARLRLALLQPHELVKAGAAVDQLPVLEQGGIELQRRYFFRQDETPPALLYLAVRAARRALAANPNEAQTYLVLGDSYLRLLHDTRERSWGRSLPELVQLRRAQASAALNQAVSLKPDFARAHLLLGRLYLEMNYRDLALDHFRAYLKLCQETRTEPEAGADEVDALAKDVDDRDASYTIQSAGVQVRDRAFIAAAKGLAGKARDLLLASDVSAFGRDGMQLELELLLRTGRAKDVWEWTDPDLKEQLGEPSYHRLRLQALAALGQYALTRQESAALAPCVALGDSPPLDDEGREKVPSRSAMALVVGRRVLDEQPLGAPYQYRWPFGRTESQQSIETLAESLRQDANVNVLRGLLALEEGYVDEAADAFREAHSLWKDEESAAAGGGLDFEGRLIARACLEWLK